MLLNPFEKLSPDLITAFRKKGKRWLVSQTMTLRAAQALGESKIFLLMSHYDDQGMATVHLKAVTNDKFAALIDLEKNIHRQQIEKILAVDSPYIVYSSLIRNKETVTRMISERYKEKYHRYIQQHAQSGISTHKSLRPSLQLIFGELFVILKYGSETLRTRLSEIENM